MPMKVKSESARSRTLNKSAPKSPKLSPEQIQIALLKEQADQKRWELRLLARDEAVEDIAKRKASLARKLAHERKAQLEADGDLIQAQVNSKLSTRFHEAVANNDVDTLQKLFDEDASLLNTPLFTPKEKRHCCTPVMSSAFTGRLQSLSLLLDLKGDPNARSKENGWTALHYAIQGGHVDAVVEILRPRLPDGDPRIRPSDIEDPSVLADRVPVDLNLHNFSGATPLSHCAILGNSACSKILFEIGGIDLDLNDSLPILHSCRSSTYTFLKQLMKRGAKLNVMDEQGNNPLHILCNTKEMNEMTYKCVKLIIDWIVDVSQMKVKLAYETKKNMLKPEDSKANDVVANYEIFDVNAENKRTFTPLMLAMDGVNQTGMNNTTAYPNHWRIKVLTKLVKTRGVILNLDNYYSHVLFKNALFQVPMESKELAESYLKFGEYLMGYCCVSGDLEKKLKAAIKTAKTTFRPYIARGVNITELARRGLDVALERRRSEVRYALLSAEIDVNNPEHQDIPIVTGFFQNPLFDLNCVKLLFTYVW